jgi:hypothetical protein
MAAAAKSGGTNDCGHRGLGGEWMRARREQRRRGLNTRFTAPLTVHLTAVGPSWPAATANRQPPSFSHDFRTAATPGLELRCLDLLIYSQQQANFRRLPFSLLQLPRFLNRESLEPRHCGPRHKSRKPWLEWPTINHREPCVSSLIPHASPFGLIMTC